MSNVSEITKEANRTNTPDINSIPNNKNERENDQDNADIVILTPQKKTKVIVIIIIIIVVIIIIGGTIIIKKFVL